MSDNESRNLPAKRPDNRPAPYRMTSKDLTGNKEPIGPARAAIARPIPAKSAASSSDWTPRPTPVKPAASKSGSTPPPPPSGGVKRSASAPAPAPKSKWPQRLLWAVAIIGVVVGMVGFIVGLTGDKIAIAGATPVGSASDQRQAPYVSGNCVFNAYDAAPGSNEFGPKPNPLPANADQASQQQAVVMATDCKYAATQVVLDVWNEPLTPDNWAKVDQDITNLTEQYRTNRDAWQDGVNKWYAKARKFVLASAPNVKYWSFGFIPDPSGNRWVQPRLTQLSQQQDLSLVLIVLDDNGNVMDKFRVPCQYQNVMEFELPHPGIAPPPASPPVRTTQVPPPTQITEIPPPGPPVVCDFCTCHPEAPECQQPCTDCCNGGCPPPPPPPPTSETPPPPPPPTLQPKDPVFTPQGPNVPGQNGHVNADPGPGEYRAPQQMTTPPPAPRVNPTTAPPPTLAPTVTPVQTPVSTPPPAPGVGSHTSGTPGNGSDGRNTPNDPGGF